MKPLPFVSYRVKDNVEVNHGIRKRGAQGLVFVQITLEKCTANFYFENSKSDINCQSVVLINMKSFRIFMEPRFQ